MFAGHNRAVWNKALAIIKDKLERKIPILWYNELNWNMTKLWKRSAEMGWLKEAPSQTLQQTKNLPCDFIYATDDFHFYRSGAALAYFMDELRNINRKKTLGNEVMRYNTSDKNTR